MALFLQFFDFSFLFSINAILFILLSNSVNRYSKHVFYSQLWSECLMCVALGREKQQKLVAIDSNNLFASSRNTCIIN